jgi:hypothetical protein
VELKCELSPLVFTVLYRILADGQEYQELLSDRLAEIEQESEWFAEAAERYEKTWQGQLKQAATSNDLNGLSDTNARLASWIIAALRTTGTSYDLGEKVRKKVTERALDEMPDPPAILPSQWCPEVMGWTLGMVVGSVDQHLPVVPAMLPADPNVSAAYEGLVEHVLHLGDTQAPWPEIFGTYLHVLAGDWLGRGSET